MIRSLGQYFEINTLSALLGFQLETNALDETAGIIVNSVIDESDYDAGSDDDPDYQTVVYSAPRTLIRRRIYHVIFVTNQSNSSLFYDYYQNIRRKFIAHKIQL